MTDRNELERLLAAATEGPWAVCTDATGDTFIASMTDSAETVCEMGAMDTGEGQAQLEADAALICFLRNNAQHYLSLMDEVERLRGELAAMKARGDRLAEALSKGGFMMTETHRLEGYTGARKLIIGFEDGEHADDAMAAIRQALTEWMDQHHGGNDADT